MQLISGISVYLASCVCACECVRVCVFVDWASITAAHLLTVPSQAAAAGKGSAGGRHVPRRQNALAARVIPDSTPCRERVGCVRVCVCPNARQNEF